MNCEPNWAESSEGTDGGDGGEEVIGDRVDNVKL